jgi:transposase
MDPGEAHETKEAHFEQCASWNRAVYDATNKVECCAWRPKLSEVIKMYGHKFDYQMFQSDMFFHDGAKPCAHAYQALVKNYFTKADGMRRKKFRRSKDPMPLQVRSGECFRVGRFGARGKNEHYYNCQVAFNGLKIRGRLPGRAPWGRILEGVSITKQADGWWASIKQEIPKRQLVTPDEGSVVGIDVGLDCIVAMSDGTRVMNPREKAYSERIAGRQAQGKEVGRLQQAASRHVRHLLYNKVVKRLEATESINVEKLTGRIGQMGSRKTSSMRTVVQMLKDRYGGRVREVQCAYTSQDCSQCGHRSKDSWSYANGPTGQCPVCGYRENRDVNAARNIAARQPILQAAE